MDEINMKRWQHAVFAVALVALCACGAGTAARVGSTAPNWTEPTASGSHLTLDSLRGKVVYLNFFATWCPPCNDEAPSLNALQKHYASKGLQIVGVDELENAAKARSFIAKYGLVYPAVVDSGTLETQYAVNGLPVHVFIGRAGTIRRIVVGEMSATEMRAEVRRLLRATTQR